MKQRFTRMIGVSLIVCSWLLWGIILVLPFFKLTLTQYAIIYPVILASTNIFWIGVTLVGKELVQKLNIVPKVKIWLKSCHVKRET